MYFLLNSLKWMFQHADLKRIFSFYKLSRCSNRSTYFSWIMHLTAIEKKKKFFNMVSRQHSRDMRGRLMEIQLIGSAISLFSLYVLFSQLRPRRNLTLSTHVCTWTRRNFKGNVLLSFNKYLCWQKNHKQTS